MKRKVLISLTSVALCASAFAALSLNYDVISAHAEETHVKSSFETIYNASADNPGSGFRYLTEDSDYNLGDGTLATFKVNKGTSTELPKIRSYNSSKYYLYLKYSGAKTNGSVGGYVEINSATGKGINKVTWDSYKSVDANKIGYQIQTLNLKTGEYEVERSVAPTEYTSPDITLTTQTNSVRIYHWIPTEATGHDFLGILDLSAYVDDALFKQLSFDSLGGNEVSSSYYYSGEVTEAPEAPTRPNEGSTKYTFAGWYTDENCLEGTEFTFGEELTEDKTLYAKWNETTVSGYTLTFVTNSNSVIEPQVAEAGSKFSTPINEPTKDSDSKYDYTFVNWYADEALTTLFDFETVYTEDKIAYAKYSYQLNELPGAKSINMKANIKTYGANWNADGKTYGVYTLQSNEVDSGMVDSTFAFKDAYNYGNYGIVRTGAEKYDVYMKRCLVTWQLNDYSKYIVSVRWDIKNSSYYNGIGDKAIVRLYANAAGTGTEVDADHMSIDAKTEGDRAIQMLNNTDETVNAVSFKQDNVSFNYGFETLKYILGDASNEQQTKNFSNAFINELTCDSTGVSAPSVDTWNTFASRIATMSSEAKTLLANNESTDEAVVNALSKYDYIIQKYGTGKYADFLNRFNGEVSPASSFNIINTNNNQAVSTVLIIAIVAGMSLLTVCMFMKKRKITK